MPRIHQTLLAVTMSLGLQVAAQSVESAPPHCNETMGSLERGSCAENSYSLIPDAHHEGITLGPVSASGSGTLEDITLSLTVSHPYSADLTFSLEYDADGDGDPEASSSVEMFLSRTQPDSEEVWHCTPTLDGTYFFKDEGWKRDGVDSDFRVFDGLSAGGDWYLVAKDSQAGQTGIIFDWAVDTAVTSLVTTRLSSH